jgi:hypothetical protein
MATHTAESASVNRNFCANSFRSPLITSSALCWPGFLYGTFIGSVIVSIASTIAAVIAFLTARYLARVWIEKSLGGKGSKFRILDNALNQDGFRIVLLIRSSPLHPYGICNYLLGLTSVTGRDYTIASFFGMLPATVMEVYLGSAAKNVTDIINGSLDNSMLSRVFFCTSLNTRIPTPPLPYSRFDEIGCSHAHCMFLCVAGAGLVVSMIVTIVVTVLLKRKLKSEMDKYSMVATDDVHEHDDGMDEFGMLGMGGSGPSVVHAPEHAEHDSALSDTTSDSELPNSAASSDVSVDITTSPLKSAVGPSNTTNKPKGKPLPEPRKLSGAAAESGLKSTRRPSKPGTKPGKSSFHTALTTPVASPTGKLVPCGAIATKGSTPKPSKADAYPINLNTPLAPPSNSTSPITPSVQDEEEILSESEALIATKEV